MSSNAQVVAGQDPTIVAWRMKKLAPIIFLIHVDHSSKYYGKKCEGLEPSMKLWLPLTSWEPSAWKES
jgi:hypothetical protein